MTRPTWLARCAVALMVVVGALAVSAPAMAATPPGIAGTVAVHPNEPPADCSSTHYFQIQNRTRSGSTLKFNLVALNMRELMGNSYGIVYYAVADESNGGKSLFSNNGNISGNSGGTYPVSFTLSATGHALLVSWSVYVGDYDVCAGHQTMNS
jgi:hypothetical protein